MQQLGKPSCCKIPGFFQTCRLPCRRRRRIFRWAELSCFEKDNFSNILGNDPPTTESGRFAKSCPRRRNSNNDVLPHLNLLKRLTTSQGTGHNEDTYSFREASLSQETIKYCWQFTQVFTPPLYLRGHWQQKQRGWLALLLAKRRPSQGKSVEIKVSSRTEGFTLPQKTSIQLGIQSIRGQASHQTKTGLQQSPDWLTSVKARA